MLDHHESLRLLQEAPALIWRAGTNAECYWFNETWLAFTGRSMEQETGNGWAEGVHPDDFDPCLALFLSAFHERRRFEMEYRILCHEGTYRWILDHGIPSTDAAGLFDGYIGFCFDITDRKLTEQALSDRQQELERANLELQDVRKSLERMALFDNLTGLPNRHNILQAYEIEDRRRGPNSLSLLIIDVDHFKSINDTYGHLVGDDCLRELGSILSRHLRSADIVGRFGGEEFVVVLPGAGRLSAREIAANLCRKVADDFRTASRNDIPLTISIGGATLEDGEPTDFVGLMKKADGALYRAKAGGRNRIVMADDDTAPGLSTVPKSPLPLRRKTV